MVNFAILFVTKKKINTIIILIVLTCFVSCYSEDSLNSDDNLRQLERDYVEDAIKNNFLMLLSTKINEGVFIICGRGAATMTGVER